MSKTSKAMDWARLVFAAFLPQISERLQQLAATSDHLTFALVCAAMIFVAITYGQRAPRHSP